MSRPIRFFVPKPSYIQNQKHIEALHRAYEATCVHGLPIGFATEQMLEHDGLPDNSELIVIPDAQFISPKALAALRQAQSTGVQLVRLGQQSITSNDYGLPYPEESVAFLKDISVFNYASAPDLDKAFGEVVQPIADQLPVTVHSRDGQNAFGVMSRHAKLNGRSILLLVNLNAESADVQLISHQGKEMNRCDVLNFEAVSGNIIHMPVKGVRLIELENN